MPLHRAPTLVMLIALGAGCLGGAGLTGCDADEVTPAPWLLDPALPMPRWLSAAGIYVDLPRMVPAAGFVTYEPPYPLSSNRASKARLLWLPAGTSIDTSDPERWQFPVGTVLVKTFAYRHVEGRYGDVAIETRVIRRAADDWQYAVYHWSTDGDEARLAEDRWPEARFLLEDVNGSDFAYVIPGALDCEACHETHAQAPVIGLDPGNLDPALLEALIFDTPPDPSPLPALDETEARAMGYIVGNCAHCHHGEARGDNASFDLRPAALRANTIGVPTASSASGDGIRVVPGDPGASALYEAVVEARTEGYRGDFKPMPPVGVINTDHEGAEILRRWIAGLEAP